MNTYSNMYMSREKYQPQTHENHDYHENYNEYKENQNEKQIEILFIKYYKLEEDVKELYKYQSKYSCDISSLEHDINGLYKRFDNTYFNEYSDKDKDKYEIEQNILQNYKSINELYNAINELQSGIRMLEKYNGVCINKINSINFHIKLLYFIFILLVIKCLLNL